MNIAYGLYMAEASNMFPQERKNSIEQAINEFRQLKLQGYNPNDYISQVLSKYNLPEYNLSSAEINYINACVDAM